MKAGLTDSYNVCRCYAGMSIDLVSYIVQQADYPVLIRVLIISTED